MRLTQPRVGDVPLAAWTRWQELQEEEALIRKSVVADQVGTEIPMFYGTTKNFIINPSNVGTGILSRMVETDDTVSTAVQFRNMMVLGKIGEYHHDDPAIKNFVNDFLGNLDGQTWAEAMESILSSVAFGFSTSEIMFGLDNALNKVPVRIATYHPSTLAFEADASGVVTPDGIIQFVLQTSQISNANNFFATIQNGYNVRNPFTTPVDRLLPKRLPFFYQYGLTRIPRNKVIHHVNWRGMSFGSPYGKTPVRTAHLAWQLKVFFLKQLGIAGKKAASPTIWGTAPSSQMNVEVTRGDGRKEKVTPREALRLMLADREQDDALITGPDKDGYHIEAIQNQANLDGMLNSINAFNVWIFRCFLMPSLIMTDGSAGSRSLGDKHFQIVDRVSEHEADKFGKHLVNELVRRPVIENFGLRKDYGSFKQRPQSIEERERMANLFGTLTDRGYMSPAEKTDYDYARSSLHLPEGEGGSYKIRPDEVDPENPQVDQDGNPIEVRRSTGEEPQGDPAKQNGDSDHPGAELDDLQDSALNGAQITSLVDIVSKVASKELPRQSAIEIIVHSFNMDRVVAEKIVGDAGRGFTIESHESDPNDSPDEPKSKSDEE